MSRSELPLEALNGFSGSVKNGFHLHPVDRAQIYPLGAAVVISVHSQSLAHSDKEEQSENGKTNTTFLHGHDGKVTALAVSPSGKYIASGERVSGGEANIIIWEAKDVSDATTFCMARRLSLHVGDIVALAFSTDESRLASVGGENDGRVVMWDISTGRALCGAPAPLDGRVRAVAFLRHSNQSFISAGELAVSAWEYDETSKRLSFQQVRLGILKRDILSIAIDEDDKYVYLGTSSADVLCVALSNHTIKESFTLKKYISKGICSLAIVRNAILAGSGDGVLSVMRREPGTCTLKFEARRLLGTGAVTSIAASCVPHSNVEGLEYPESCKSEYSKRKYLHGALLGLRFGNVDVEQYRDASQTFDVYCGMSNGNLHLVEYCANHPLNGKCLILAGVKTLESSHEFPITSLAFPLQTDEYFATGGGPEICVWRTKTARSMTFIEVKPRSIGCLCLSFMPGSNDKVIISGWDDGKIRAHHMDTGQALFVAANAHDRVTAVRGMKDACGVISGGSEGNVRLWHVRNLNVITLQASMKEHRSTVNDIVLFDGDVSAVTASDDGSCIVWDLERRVRRVSFFGSTYFKAIAIHPDELQIVTTGTDRKITWWDPTDASILRVVDDPSDAELAAATIAHPDGALLAVAGSDRTIKVFDYESGDCTHASAHLTAPAVALAFAPGGRALASASADGAVCVWSDPRGPSVALAELGREKERHIHRVLTGERPDVDDDDDDDDDGGEA